MVDGAKIVKMIEMLMRFPFPQICRHSVAADLLSLLEESGYTVTPELACAVVSAKDAEALALLPTLTPKGT